MNKEKQRIAIAEACGWKCNGHPDQLAATVGWELAYQFVLTPEGKLVTHNSIPDYLNDLNAVHDFVSQKFKSKFMLAEYEYMLRACLADGRPTFEVAGYELANATAAQKAEALLKALNLWKNA
jgi:hypothetical protein